MYQTKYLGPTNSHVARVKVTNCYSGRYTYVPWDDSLNVNENHTAAFKEFLAKDCLGEKLSDWVWISMEDGNMYVRRVPYGTLNKLGPGHV